MATEDNEILRNRGPIQVPIAVRDETYNTVRDVEDKVRLENELYQRQRAYTEYMEEHPEAVDAEINRINAELQHDLNLLSSRYSGDPNLYNKLAEDRKQIAREQIETLPGYNIWFNWKYGPTGAVLTSAPENYGQNYNQVSPEQQRLNQNAIDFSRYAFSNIGSGAYYQNVDPRNQDAVNAYVSNAAVQANIINDAQAATGALGLVRGIPGAVNLLRGAAPRIGSGLGRGAGYALEAVTPSTYLKPAARFFTSNPATINTIGGLGDAAAASYFLTNAATNFYNDPSLENGAWLGLSSIPFFRPVRNMLGAAGNLFSSTPIRVGRFNIGETPTVGLQVGEYGVGYPLNRAASNPMPIGGRVSGPQLPARVFPSQVTRVTSEITSTGAGAKGTGRLNGNRVTIDGKEYVIEVNPDGTAVLTGNDGAQSVIRVTPPKAGAKGSARGNNYQNVAQDVEYEIIDDSQGMLTGRNSGVPQTVPGSGASVDEGQLFQYIDNSGQRNIGPYSKVMQIAEREGNPYAVSRYTGATETSAGVDATGTLRGNGVNPTTNSGNNVPGAPTRTGNVPAVYNPGRSGSVPAPRPANGNGNDAAVKATVDELINSGLFTNNGGGTAYASQGSMYTRTPHIFGPRQVESITIKGVEFRPVNGNGRVVTLEAPDGRIVDLPIENLNSQKVKYTVNYGPRRMFVRTPPNSRYYAFGKVADPAFTTTPWFVNNPTSVWMPQTSWQTTYRPWIYGGAALTGGYFGGRKLGFWGGDDDEDSRSIYEQLEENYRNGTNDGTMFDGNVNDTTPRNANPDETVIVDDNQDPQSIQDGTGGTSNAGATVSTQLPSDTLGYANDPNAAAEFDIMMQVAQQVVNNDPNSDFSKRYKQMMAEGKSDDEIVSYITSWWNSIGRAQYTVPAQ